MTVVFLAIGICGLLLIGNDVTSDLNTSLGFIDGTLMCQLARVVFSSLILAVLGQYYFTCKECCLVVIDEVGSQSMSQTFEDKLSRRSDEDKSANAAPEKANDDDEEPLI